MKRKWLDYTALAALGLGALATVLAVLPYRSFDLDRFFVPKELALHVSATVAGAAALIGVRRHDLTRADVLLLAWLALSLASGLFAANHWAAFRAVTLSVSGAVVFWTARHLARAGLGQQLARVLGAVVVVGALTALAQAYGVPMEFAALNRAPGGTYGNRNFMAHLAAAGLPLLFLAVASARSRFSLSAFAAGLGACAGALVLSRTRAAWLALMVWGAIWLFVKLRAPALPPDPETARRSRIALAASLAGVVLALIVPNTLDWKSDSPYLESVKGVVNYREGSGRGRLRQYQHSAVMAATHPLLGVGPGNWPVVYPKYAPGNDPSLAEGTGMTSNPWPSSDWVAALSERGVLAALALGGCVLLLVVSGLRARWRPTTPDAERFGSVGGSWTVAGASATVGAGALAGASAMAAASVLAIAAIEGMFDAVLLLPTPALVVWGAAGALLPAGRVVRRVELSRRGSVLLLVGVLAAGGAASIAGEWRIEAMKLYSTSGTIAALERAVARDPGSYRIRMRLAERYADRGVCAKARPHALAARDLFPSSPGPRQLLARCPAA